MATTRIGSRRLFCQNWCLAEFDQRSVRISRTGLIFVEITVIVWVVSIES